MTRKKIITSGLFLLLTFVSEGTQSHAQKKGIPFSLTLTTDSVTVKAGTPLYIQLEMKNLSAHPINCTSVPSDGLDLAYRYTVRLENGKEAAKVTGPKRYRGTEFSIWPCTIKPGESAKAAGGPISKLYDFDTPGVYRLQASRSVSETDSKAGTVTSNELVVTVIQ